MLLLIWVLFYWISAFLAPRQQTKVASATSPMLSKALAEKIVTAHLFGGARSGSVDAASAQIAAPSNIGVSGIYAGRDGRSGFAVLILDGNPVSAVVGQEFAPGMVLQRAYPDYVEILRGGQIETAHMTTAPSPVSAPRETKPPKTTGIPALPMNVHQLGPGQFVFSRDEMLATLQSSNRISLLGHFAPLPSGAARLEQSPAGSLAEKLGLKIGDVVTRINGKPLSGPGDVAQLYEQMTKSESVNMLVLRAGNKMNIGIQVE